MNRDGEIVRADYEEHYAPDTHAAALWLSNRQPGRWKLKSSSDVSGDVGVTVKVVGGLPEKE